MVISREIIKKYLLIGETYKNSKFIYNNSSGFWFEFDSLVLRFRYNLYKNQILNFS